jgi:hypothetical protein
MGGECAAQMRPPVKKSITSVQFLRGERLCGFSRVTGKPFTDTSARLGAAVAHNTRSEEPTRLAAAALTNSCNSDCGGCLSTAFNTNRSRGVLATSHARVTAVANQFGNWVIDLVRQRGAVCRLSSPRGPPIFS